MMRHTGQEIESNLIELILAGVAFRVSTLDEYACTGEEGVT
jgi:hypothetical protein